MGAQIRTDHGQKFTEIYERIGPNLTLVGISTKWWSRSPDAKCTCGVPLKAGVEFIAENGGGPGVRIRKSAKGAEEISRQIDALEDKISSMPAPTEPSPEAGMNIMRKAVAKNDLAKLKNRRKRIRSDRSK